jgi:hypothetical protein
MQVWLKTSKLLIVAFSVAALAFVGCGDDDDDGGGKSVDPTGAGAAITEANAAEIQGTVFATVSGLMAKGNGTHEGEVSGTVKITQSIGKAAQGVAYKMVFNDYSDDGQIWLDGTINFSTTLTGFSYSINVEIAGAYSGKVEGEINATTTGGASGYWIVDGTRIDIP